jgi:F-type H+-transporting ATPase subunit delta
MRTTIRTTREARRLFRLCLVEGALDGRRAVQVARRIAASGRRGARRLLGAFQRLVRLDQDRHTAVIESAAPLVAPVRDAIRKNLMRRYGPRIAASFRENPALIGGVRIKAGSDVYDGSVRGRLNTLTGRL